MESKHIKGTKVHTQNVITDKLYQLEKDTDLKISDIKPFFDDKGQFRSLRIILSV